MEKLYEKIDNLLKVLDEQVEVKEIKRLNKSDKSLLNEIESNKLFQEYKEKETDLNILILKINERLKEITKKESCQK